MIQSFIIFLEARFRLYQNRSLQVDTHFALYDTQGRMSARRSDTTAARLAEVGRRWCHCLYAWEPCVWQRERKTTEENGGRRAEKNVE